MAQPDDSAAAKAPPITARGAMLGAEFPAILDFDDAALEWRRLFSELFGTFLLVTVGPVPAS